MDYLEHERASSDSEYVFLSLKPPFSHISVHLLGKLTSAAIRSAGIVPGGRKCGPHAFRASLASSMVNDDVPYEVVRNTLGHTDVNAIKSYDFLLGFWSYIICRARYVVQINFGQSLAVYLTAAGKRMDSKWVKLWGNIYLGSFCPIAVRKVLPSVSCPV